MAQLMRATDEPGVREGYNKHIAILDREVTGLLFVKVEANRYRVPSPLQYPSTCMPCRHR